MNKRYNILVSFNGEMDFYWNIGILELYFLCKSNCKRIYSWKS